MTFIGPEVLDELQRSGDTSWEWVVSQKRMRRQSNDAPRRIVVIASKVDGS